MADTVRYSEGQVMFGDLEIICDGFKVTYKRDTEDLTSLNSSTPYDTQFGKESVEAECSDVDPALRKDLKRLYEQKVKDTLASYDFDEDTGNLIEDDVLYGAHITELGKEDINKPFSVKFGVTSYKKQ